MNHFTSVQQALLVLVRRSLWGEAPALPQEVDWSAVAAAAKAQGVITFAYDGAVSVQAPVPPDILQGWKTKMLQGVVNNERLLCAQDALLARLAEADIPAVVLKGSSVSRYYPQGSLRVLGDIDILVDRGNVDAAKAVLNSMGYQMKESDHEFHIGYSRPGAYVELHYDVTLLPDSAGGRVTREITDRFLENTGRGSVDGHSFPVLSEQNQAFMLLLHMVRHMFSGGIGLRQLCDWMMYLEKTDKRRFAGEVLPLLERCGLLQYARVATGVCVRYLGLSGELLEWCADVREDACRAFLQDIFCGGNMGKANTETMGGMFVDSSAMGTGKSSLLALIHALNKLAYKNFPFTRKCKVLLPFFWLYMPLRYFVRSLLGLRPKKSAAKAIHSAKQKRSLYEMVELFVIDD